MNNSQYNELLKLIAKLQQENAALRQKVSELEAKNAELEKRLAVYENAHTPPSLRKRWRKPPQQPTGKTGAPLGHEGTTRPTSVPDKIVDVKPLKHCPNCNEKLGAPEHIEKRIIEDIPEPQPVRITQFNLPHQTCPCCGMEIVAQHPNCPNKGKFGNNLLAHVSLLKYDGRLPHRKIVESLQREHGLEITPATVLDINNRVTKKLEPEYNKIINRVQHSKFVHVDETGLRVAGAKYWIWIFVTNIDCLAVVSYSRGKKVLKQILGEYAGTIICDGWKPYSNYSKNIQRCWAHLLREIEWIAQDITEATSLNKALHKLYNKLAAIYKRKLSIKKRQKTWQNAVNRLNYWLNKKFAENKIVKLCEKIRNGLKHWFTFILNPDIEPTNNIAERALREHVVQRKIFGCLRNQKGTHNHEVIMSLIATWKLQGLNPQTQILKCLRS